MEWSDVVEDTVPQEILPIPTFTSHETQTEELSSVSQIRRPKYSKEVDGNYQNRIIFPSNLFLIIILLIYSLFFV